MKRFLCVLLVALALVGLMTTVASAEEYAMVTSENGYGVRMREGPSKAYRVVTKYDVGTTVIVQQRGTEWSQIRVGETVGWMMNEFLVFGTSGTGTGSGGESGGVGTGTVVSDNGLRVWLRTTPNGKRIQLYSPGTAVTILSYGDEWHYISIGGVRGYMMSRYISVTPPPAPSSKAVEAVGINYPSPVVDDVLQAVVTPSDATVTYSWKVDGVEQGNTASLRVLNAYIGKKITLTVTGTGVYYGSKTYTTDEVVSSRRVTAVSLSKEQPFVGDTLTANIKPSSATVTYSWRVGGAEVSTESSYTVQESDLGKLIQLKVTGYETFSGVAICSASGNVLSNRELYSVSLSIKDRPLLVGDVVSATVIPSGTTGNYTWRADGDVVATTASYKVTADDLGKKITVTVEGTSPYSGTVTAAAYGTVKQATITSVSINNTKPVAGNTLTAVLAPSSATATYEWYVENGKGGWQKEGSGTSFAVPETITVDGSSVSTAGKRVKVRAYANENSNYGVNNANGYIESSATEGIISGKKISSVTIYAGGSAIGSNAPVAGNVLEARLSPSALESARKSRLISFVWTVGTEVYANDTGTYTVKGTDVGKTIKVKAIGANGYTGEATSATTAAVVGSAKLQSAAILIDGSNANAGSTAPQVGQILKASVNPASALDPLSVTYAWKVDNAVVGTGDTLTLQAAWKGKSIRLEVTGKSPYSGTVAATTRAVEQYPAMSANFKIAAPVAGATPQTSVSYSVTKDNKTETICTGSIVWYDAATGAVAELDSKGHFKPAIQYFARLTLTAKSGYGWIGASIKVNDQAATAVKEGGNVFDSAPFPATAGAQITRYYISGIPRPVPGQVASVFEYTTDQYTAKVNWGSCIDSSNNTFVDMEKYTAVITLTPANGYSATTLPDNLFKVSTADATVSTVEGNTVKVTATFNISRTLTVTAERTTVNIDGTNAVIIQCFASLSNMAQQPSGFEWSVRYAQSNNTWIDKDTGKLNIGGDEIVDRELVVEAKVKTADGKEYSGSLPIQLVSGTNENTAITAVFNGTQPTSVTAGTNAQFTAYATNSVMGVGWAVEYANSGDTEINKDGLLTVGADETAPSINIVAYPLEAPGNRVRANVKINTSYTVIYEDGMGGKAFASKRFDNLASGTATPSFGENPTYADAEFVGWYPALESTVTGNVTYTAEWKTTNVTPLMMALLPDQTVTYTDGVEGEEIFADQTTTGLFTGDATPAFQGTPEREGYEFTGWEPAVTELVTGTVTYTAQWQEKPADATFTVTYTDGVEDAVIFNDQATSGLLAGDATPAMADPVREGYRFDGWEPAVSETVSADTTYTAKWTKLYNIVFLDGTEENNVVLSQQVAEGENTPLPANPTREGYDFDAWIDQNGNGWGDSASKPVTGDATYTATWRAHDAVDGTTDTLENGENTVPGVHVVVTNGVDGGVIGESTSQTIMDAYAYVQSLAAPTHPTDPAMVFAGWSDFQYDEVGGVVTFEATWKAAETEQPADTTDEQPADTTEEQPADTTDEQPADTTDEQPADTTDEQPEGPVLYTITYTDGQGNELSSYQLEEGSPMPACAAPERDLFVFTGWNPGVAETVTADVTYEAQWADDWNANGIPDSEDARHTITYKDEDGTVYKTETAVLTGMGTPACAAPEKEGMVFEGWSPAVADIATADATYVAQWSEVKPEEEADETDAAAGKNDAAKDEKASEEAEEPEEPDDETLEKEYEALAESSNIHIAFEKGASKIGRGKSSTYVVKVSGVPEGVQASISWRLSGTGLIATSGKASGDGFKVTVGEGETAESLRVVVTVRVGDISISRGKRVSIVDPTVQTEEEKEETAESTAKPEDGKKPDASKEQPSEDTKEEIPESTDTPAMTEEEMAEQAMKEGNSDPAALSF
ncbi:MAG TPA: InlB B-repeat-containing protein [Candidatus Limiplasma pullistercoris]|nr:InlB B-repeat-containing protein [Candidatus Limiplasma pullistercoris]